MGVIWAVTQTGGEDYVRTECGGASEGSGPQQLFRQSSGQLSRALCTMHTRPSGAHSVGADEGS